METIMTMVPVVDRDRRTIRLGCWECMRSDKDGITPAELKACELSGWQDIERRQTLRQSRQTFSSGRRPPKSFSILDWETHLGTCPECARESEERGERLQQEWEANAVVLPMRKEDTV
jgi:hypothetical protein